MQSVSSNFTQETQLIEVWNQNEAKGYTINTLCRLTSNLH